MTRTDDLLAAARALATEARTVAEPATPGPWDAEDCEGELTVRAGTARTTWTEHAGLRTGRSPSSYATTDMIVEHDLDTWDRGVDTADDQRRADAALIAWARTGVVQMAEVLDSLAAELDELRTVSRGDPAIFGAIYGYELGEHYGYELGEHAIRETARSVVSALWASRRAVQDQLLDAQKPRPMIFRVPAAPTEERRP